MVDWSASSRATTSCISSRSTRNSRIEQRAAEATTRYGGSQLKQLRLRERRSTRASRYGGVRANLSEQRFELALFQLSDEFRPARADGQIIERVRQRQVEVE